MRPPCENLTRSFLKEIRQTVAISLATEAKLSQPQIAQILNVSQPVVHAYLRAKPTSKPSGLETMVETTANEIITHIKNDGDAEQIIRTLCSACVLLRQIGPFCRYHRESIPGLSTTCTACLPTISETTIQKKTEVLKELEKASTQLLELPNIHRIVPEIGMQFAFASEEAEERKDVVTFPGRLVKVKTNVVAMAAPEFGISKISSTILLNRMKVKSVERAMISIRNTEEIRTTLQNMGEIVVETQGADKDWEGTLTQLVEEDQLQKLNVLADIGSPGFESVAYLFGETPTSIVQKIEKLLTQMAEL